MKQRESMNTNEVLNNDATSDASGKVDMRLEVDIIPVSSVDRSKQFYERLGWRLDDDVAPLDGLRIVQFTPPGSGPGCRASTGNGGPCQMSLTSMLRPTSSSRATSMSETVSPPSAEPGKAVVSPWPNVTEAPEPGGVNWTIRRPGSGAASSSSRQPSRW